MHVVQYLPMKMKRKNKKEQSLGWLPIDSRLITPLLSFSHVKGVAKLFLVVEMILAFSVVVGTFVVLLFHFVS